jgi:hypothetical protein
VEPKPAHSERPESVAHWVAHTASVFLRPVFLIFLTATIVLMATFWPLAVVTGFLAVAVGTVLWVSGRVEDHTEAGTAPGSMPTAIENIDPAEEARIIHEEDRADEVEARVILHESRTVAGIVVGLAILAVLVGVTLFEWPMVALGVAIVFLYMAIVSTPVWLAWIEGEVEEQHRQEAGAAPATEEGLKDSA